METAFILIVLVAALLCALLLVLLARGARRSNGIRLPQERAAEGQLVLEEFHRSREETRHVLNEAFSLQASQLRDLREEIARFGQGNDSRLEALRETVDRKLGDIQRDNAARLELMRKTVDEKLGQTLERRLGSSFKFVGDRLEQVQAGLGEMRTLAAGVGDLKRVFANVKNRGSWGEVQLVSIVEDLLAPNQYRLNTPVQAGSAERVELAIVLPGKGSGENPVLLPIDAKFPKEDYERLILCREKGDEAGAVEARKAFERRLKLSAKEISSKYLAPPHTTDFAVMFLPGEALFAEALASVELARAIQNEYRVVLCGPTTLAGLLSSLRMGFKSLAVEQRTSEVWQTLVEVQREFVHFGDLIEKTRKKLQEAGDSLDGASRRSVRIQKRLDRLGDLPEIPGR